MTLLELLPTTARARVVTPDILERIAHRRLGRVMVVLTVRAVDVTSGAVVMFMGVIVATIGAVDVGLGHAEYS
ncbi:hypothetical protein GY26_11875 [Gammaproteobacteria bacterium MFB021]|nr:hypothetical protein GY26_11875 [Gammaproteobacteria bacterium MFB021]